MNKKESSKDLYRGLGSIDIVAAARSVLQVEKEEENTNIRTVQQIKNSLAPIGKPLRFEICPETGFRWREADCSPMPDEQSKMIINQQISKHQLAAIIITQSMKHGDVEAQAILRELEKNGIGEKTIQEVKAYLGVRSYRKMRKWYWTVGPESGERGHK